ncbi:MAG: hypothetical protein IT303_06060 [Dehalococcoidia bacterium]|nr:hypothetical protein [Dehalococcoidia bacterium]
MSDEFGVDLDEVRKVIDAADVLVVRFHLIKDRLLVDFRTREGSGPFMALVPRAESVEERFRSIKKLRPEFPFPEKVMSFAWPRSTPVLLASGIWEHLVTRMTGAGGPEAAELCRVLVEQMIAEERKEVLGAIRGAEHYQTLWERQRA